jgi:hypothetical protein
MRLFTVLGIIFYAVTLILIGLSLVAFSFNLLSFDEINSIFTYAQNTFNARIIIGLSGLVLIVISFSIAQFILGRFQRERTIAFTTSSGEVTISLSAVEDLIKRLASQLPEIKELRPDVIASKKGIYVQLRVTLRSEANIPELTGRLQDLTKTKIQEVLGIDEQIIVRIHVAKIISVEEKDRRRKDAEKNDTSIPYSSYGRA